MSEITPTTNSDDIDRMSVEAMSAGLISQQIIQQVSTSNIAANGHAITEIQISSYEVQKVAAQANGQAGNILNSEQQAVLNHDLTESDFNLTGISREVITKTVTTSIITINKSAIDLEVIDKKMGELSKLVTEKLEFSHLILNAPNVSEMIKQMFKDCMSNDELEAMAAIDELQSLSEQKEIIKNSVTKFVTVVICSEHIEKRNSDGRSSKLSENERIEYSNKIIADVIEAAYALFIPGYQAKSNAEEKKEKGIDVSSKTTQTTHTVTTMTAYEMRTFDRSESKVAKKVIIIALSFFVIDTTIEKMKEKRIEEEEEQKLEELNSRIKHEAIKKDTLNREVKTSEINRQRLI